MSGESTGDLSRLQAALDFRRFHHDSIWEEQKHFSWLISIILSGALVAFASDQFSPSAKAVIVLTASALGFLFSLTAFRIQRREGVLFTIAQQAFVREWNAQFPDNELLMPRGDGNFGKDAPTHDSGKSPANRGPVRLIFLGVTGRAGVRDYFQLLFLFFALAFVALGAYQVWHM